MYVKCHISIFPFLRFIADIFIIDSFMLLHASYKYNNVFGNLPDAWKKYMARSLYFYFL